MERSGEKPVFYIDDDDVDNDEDDEELESSPGFEDDELESSPGFKNGSEEFEKKRRLVDDLV